MQNLQNLRGKNILFLCVQTFNLEKDIIQQLEKHGAHVTYFDERPSNSNLIKGLIRLKRNHLTKESRSTMNAFYSKFQALNLTIYLSIVVKWLRKISQSLYGKTA